MCGLGATHLNETTNTKHKRYDEAFKQSAVEHWLISGKSARQVAAELGINVQNLPKWKQKFKELPAGQVVGTLEALQAENRRLQRDLHRLMQQRDILKNLGHNLRTARQRFERIKAMQTEYPIAELCATLGVARSGYQAWANRAPGVRARANAALLPLITQAHRESRQTYGSPRIRIWLQQQGQLCGRQRISKLMRVAGVLDRCTRRCVGWAVADTLATTLPLSAMDMALKQRRPTAGLVHHSDRGVQYASLACRHRLAPAGVIPSLSRPRNGYDNAAMESFWSSLKRELVHRRQFATRAEARAAIFEWIEVFYNRERFHSALGFKSPVDFETQPN